MSGTWPSGWVAGDVVTAAEFAKGVGAIYNTTLGSAAASVDVTGIIAGYAHLFIVCHLRGDTAATTAQVLMRFNNDSGANYVRQRIDAASTAVNASQATGQTSTFVGDCPAASATASLDSTHLILVSNYANALSFKSCVSVYFARWAASVMEVGVSGGDWASAAAINRVTLLPSAGNFAIGSRVTIYGMGS